MLAYKNVKVGEKGISQYVLSGTKRFQHIFETYFGHFFRKLGPIWRILSKNGKICQI